MKLEIKKCTFKNFFSYGSKANEIEWKEGFNLILGYDSKTGRSNMSGKTSLIESIPFALFGETSKGVNKPAIVNWKNRKNCEVLIEFSKGGKDYAILRGLRPNTLKVYENGVEIPVPPSKVDFQKQIEEDILSMNYKTFIQLVHLNANDNISILNLPKNIKRNIIEQLFNLEYFTALNHRANNKLAALTIKSQDVEMKIKMLKQDIQYLTSKIEDKNELCKGIKSYSREIANIEQQISDIENGNNKKDLEKHKNTLESLGSEGNIDFIIKKRDETINLRDNNKTELSELKTEKRILKEKIDELNIDTENSQCPTCHQKITEKYKEKIQKEIKKNTDKITTIDKKQDILIKEIDTLNDDITKLNEDINRARAAEQDRNKLNSKIDQLEKIVKEEDSYLQRLNSELEWYKEQAREDRKKSIKLNTEIDNIKNEKTEKEEEIAELIKRKNNFANLRDHIDWVKILLKDENMKQYAIGNVLPFLNSQVNKYLGETGVAFHVELSKWLDPTLKGPGISQENSSYSSLSGAERRSVDFSMLLSLLDVTRANAVAWPDVLLLDEILDSSVDDVGTNQILDIIRLKQKRDKSKVLIISHKPEVNDFDADNIIRVIKNDKGYSEVRIEE